VIILLCYSRQAKGITLKIAGNNRLVPVQRVTDEDVQVLASVLCTAVFVTGEYLYMFDVSAHIVLVYHWAANSTQKIKEIENISNLDFSFSSSLFIFVYR